jgi:hypothetical protein
VFPHAETIAAGKLKLQQTVFCLLLVSSNNGLQMLRMAKGIVDANIEMTRDHGLLADKEIPTHLTTAAAV